MENINFRIKTIFNFVLVFCCFSSIIGEINTGIEMFFFTFPLFKKLNKRGVGGFRVFVLNFRSG